MYRVLEAFLLNATLIFTLIIIIMIMIIVCINVVVTYGELINGCLEVLCICNELDQTKD